MEKLPQEIVDRISSYLEAGQLAHTLTVNRKFQHGAERYSGAFEEFDLSEATAEKFLDTYSDRRYRYLRFVQFSTSLPDPTIDCPWGNPADYEGFPCRESEEDLRSLDKCFTQQIDFLFATLKRVEDRHEEHDKPCQIQLTIRTPVMPLDRTFACHHRVFSSSLIHLLAPQKLPELTSVRSLRIKNGLSFNPFYDPSESLRLLDLRILLDLADKLPNLGYMSCAIGGNEWPTALCGELAEYLTRMYQGPRRDSRHDFSRALAEVSLSNLREVKLNFVHPFRNSSAELIDQRKAMPNLTAPCVRDPFSSSLRILSYQLRRMNLFAVIDETIFLPHDNSTPPFWPRLESINVRFHMVSSSGTWYFKGLHGEGCIEGYELDDSSYPPLDGSKEESDVECTEEGMNYDETAEAQFRVVPNEDNLVPLLIAFNKATVFMPSLKEAALWCSLRFDVEDMGGLYDDFDMSALPTDPNTGTKMPDLEWGIAYTSPNRKAFVDSPGVDYSNFRQMWWKVGTWRPSLELHQAFQRIGSEKHSKSLVEYWSNDEDCYQLRQWAVFRLNERQVFPDYS